MRRATALPLLLAFTACAHPLDAVVGTYEATPTVTLGGGTNAHRTHTLTGTVVAATDEAVAGTVSIELSQTVDTSNHPARPAASPRLTRPIPGTTSRRVFLRSDH